MPGATPEGGVRLLWCPCEEAAAAVAVATPAGYVLKCMRCGCVWDGGDLSVVGEPEQYVPKRGDVVSADAIISGYAVEAIGDGRPPWRTRK